MQQSAWIIVLTMTLILGIADSFVYAAQVGSGALAGLGNVGRPCTGNADDVSWNPAALGETKYRFQFLVTPISLHVSSDDWSIETVLSLLTGTLSPEDRAEIEASLDGGDISWSVDLRGGADLALGSNAMGGSLRSHARGTVSSGAASLVILGASPGRTYVLDGTDAEGVVFTEAHLGSAHSDVSVTEALRLSGFHVGTAVSYLHGLQYVKVRALDESLTVIEEGGQYKKIGDGRFSTWISENGWGLSTDVGIWARVTPTVSIDASIVDLGRMQWQNVQETEYELVVDPESGESTHVNRGTRPIASKPLWDLPTTARAGLSFDSGPGVRCSLQYVHGLAGSQVGRREVALVTQLSRVKALPLRLGVKYSNDSEELSFSFGMGLHLGPLTFDIGSPNLAGLLGRGKEASIAVTTGLRF